MLLGALAAVNARDMHLLLGVTTVGEALGFILEDVRAVGAKLSMILLCIGAGAGNVAAILGHLRTIGL